MPRLAERSGPPVIWAVADWSRSPASQLRRRGAGRQPSDDQLPVGGRARLPVQQHQFVSTQSGWRVSGTWVGGHGGVLLLGDAPRRTGTAVGSRTPQPEHDQPSGQRDQPEAGEAVEQYGGQGLAGTQPGRYQGQAERSLGDP